MRADEHGHLPGRFETAAKRVQGAWRRLLGRRSPPAPGPKGRGAGGPSVWLLFGLLCGPASLACERPHAVLGEIEGGSAGESGGPGSGGGAGSDGGPSLPEVSFNYENPELLWHFQTMVPGDWGLYYTVTNRGATLGRVLFYDARLSDKGNLRCASCHQQKYNFSSDQLYSVQVGEHRVQRRALPLFNLYWVTNRLLPWTPADGNSGFFSEGRAPTLDAAIKESLISADFIHAPKDLVQRLEKLSYYPPLFEAAFGDSTITQERIIRALREFVLAIISDQSRLDQTVGKGSASPKSPESLLSLFQDTTLVEGIRNYRGDAGCTACHGDVLKPNVNRRFANIGLDEKYKDPGLAALGSDSQKEGIFVVPSLRSVVARPRLMHDGRFGEPGQALQHYLEGIAEHPNLSPGLEGTKKGLQAAMLPGLQALLEALDDKKLRTEAKFSDPFVTF